MKIAKKFACYIGSLLVLLAIILWWYIQHQIVPFWRFLTAQSEKAPVDTFWLFVHQEELFNGIVFGLLSVITIAYIVGVFFYFQRHIIRPLVKMVALSDRLRQGEFPAKLEVESDSDEISDLERSLNFQRDRLHNSINKLKVSHERERLAREKAESSNTMKSNFIARLAPELRSPLNSIIGFNEIIRNDISKGCYDRRLAMLVDALGHSAEMLDRQISRLLDISLLSSGSDEVNITEFGTAEFMNELLEYNAFCINNDDLELINHFTADMPAVLATDRSILAIVLGVLIRTLAQVAGPGEVISCSCIRDGDEIIFSVRDNRRSNSREQLAMLYNLGANLAALPGHLPPDTISFSLLFVARKAALIGGKMAAESNEASQSEFKLTFPVWEILPDRGDDSEGTPRIASNLRHSNSLQDRLDQADAEEIRPALKILLAENDRDNALVIKTLLEDDGHQLDVINDGMDLESTLLETDYDLVIISLTLPQINVVGAIKRICREPEFKRIPVVVIAGFLTEPEREQMLEFGVKRCLVKPLNFARLRKMVFRVAERPAGLSQ